MSIETWRIKKVALEREPTHLSYVCIFGVLRVKKSTSFSATMRFFMVVDHPFFLHCCLGIEDLEQNVVSSRGRGGLASTLTHVTHIRWQNKQRDMRFSRVWWCNAHVVITTRWAEFCCRAVQETRKKMQRLRHDNNTSEIIEKARVSVIVFVTFLIAYTKRDHWTAMDERETNMVRSDWLVMSRNGKLVALLCLSTSSMTLQSSWLFSSFLLHRRSQVISSIFDEGWWCPPSFSRFPPFSFLYILGSENVDFQKYPCNIICLRAFFLEGWHRSSFLFVFLSLCFCLIFLFFFLSFCFLTLYSKLRPVVTLTIVFAVFITL